MERTFAHYEILGAIGAGGMGEVWKARDSRLGRLVALKLLPEDACDEDGTLERFRREAQSASRLNHPNICTIYDFLEDDGRFAIVMELLEGENLQDRLARGPLAVDDMLRIAVPVADAIAFAHSQGVLHRDIKPGNIFLSQSGIAKILDFGLAKLTEPNANTLSSIDATVVSPGPDASLTQMGGTVGTVSYMSPEQALGRDLDARSDVFSFGATLYEMATGQRAFDGPTMAAVTDALLHRDPVRASELRSEIPAGLENVIVKSMQKDREDRFEDMHALARALKEADWSEAPKKGAKTEKTSIAVLPFRHMSADADDEYFADGMAEEIINSLAKIGPLRVVSRTSSFAFKGRDEDIREIGSALDVNVVLEGSVRKSGNRVRITSQLINVEDGYHLWSERFDRTMDDIFAVQDEIAESIAKALEIVLTNEEREAIREIPTDSAEAYEYYLRGRFYLWKLNPESFLMADSMFRAALKEDPEFLLALASRVELYSWFYLWLPVEDKRSLQSKAEELARQSQEIAPDRAETRFAFALTHWMKQEHAKALQLFQEAAEIDPGYWEAHFYGARVAMEGGRLDVAAMMFEQAYRIRPDEYQAMCLRSTCLRGEPEEAKVVAEAKKILERHIRLHPDDNRALGFLVTCYAFEGDEEETRALGEELQRRSDVDAGFLYNVACAYIHLGWKEEAFEILFKIVKDGWGNPEWLDSDPDMDPLRDDPRFGGLIDEIKKNRERTG
ncbi:MAG: protein kinase [Gemmatimonadetes bacterium]|nr:protein kinase [Gemmatimonadota bacterium]